MKEALKLALEEMKIANYNSAAERLEAALAQPTSGDYALGYAEGFNDACKPKPAHVISEQEQLKQWIETTKYFTAKREYEPWCMGMNGCKTKCADCPDEPAQEPVAWQVEMFIAGAWVPLGNPQRDRTRAESLASNPSLPKEHQRLVNVYATPQQRSWVGLTEEEIEVIEALKAPPVHPDFVDCDDWMNFARAIEAKLKELNT